MPTRLKIITEGKEVTALKAASGTNKDKYVHTNASTGALEYSSLTGSGDVLGPATNTDSYIPQWNGANSKTLKDGLAVPAGGLAGITLVDTKQDKLTCVSKTTNYTANPSELVNCDVSGGSFTVTLPSAPADKTVIYVKLNQTGVNQYVTLKAGGTDKFNTPTGNTEIYLYLFGEYAQCQYCSTTGLWTTFISAGTFNFATQFPGVDATTPITNANISIDTTTRVLTITPPLGYFNIFVDGGGIITRYRKVGNITFPAFTDTSGTWYFYFDASGTAITTQTAWTVEQFPTIVPIYRLLWNATLYNFTVSSANVNEGDTYTNNGQTFTVRQTQTGTTTVKMVGTGAPAASGNLVRATGTGTDPLVFSAVDSTAVRLVAQYIEYHLNDIPADVHQWFHLQGAQWVSGYTMVNNALVTGAPAADGRNTVMALSSGSITDDNLEYTITNDSTPTDAWQQDLGNITAASLNATNSALFKIFRRRADGTISFRDATRFPFDWSIATNVPQYLTANGVRTPVTNQRYMVNFVYSTQNPVPGEPLKVVSATQDFTTLANARAYTWTDIQNTYSTLNDGETRPLYRLIHEVHTGVPNAYTSAEKYSVLRETQDLRKAAVTSTTAATGSLPASSVTVVPAGNISSTNAQSALEELDAEKLNLDQTTSQTIANGQPIQGTLTASELVATDANKKLQSLAVATYPSLTELSYVKGVTSALQTQINGKQATLTNPVTGTGTTNEIAYWSSGSAIGTLAVATYPSLTELSYVKGVTSAIQTQLGGKASTAAASTSAAGLAPQATAPASGLYNYLGITNGETAYSNKALFDATAPSTQAFGDSAATGSAAVAARRDHKHAMPANPVSGTINEIGYFDTTGSVKSLAVATYPSLTELSYVKGVTSGIQTQLNAKGVGDMVLASAQSVTGAKTFDKDKILMKGTSTGVTTISTAQTDASSYTQTLQARNGTIANLDNTTYIGTTSVALNRGSGALSLAGVTTDGNLALAGGTMTGAITTKVGDGIILPSGGGILLTLPATDAYVTGPYTNSFQSGATIAAGNLVYMGSSSKWLIADADAIATCGGLMAIAMEAKNDTQAMKVALPGSFVRFDAWNWTPGATIYAGETAGGLQTTIPTGADGVIRVIGFAVDADTIYFNPSSDNSTVVA